MPRQHTQTPSSTGSSVLGIVFKDGVIVAADNLASYGSMLRYMGVPRVMQVNKDVVLGCGGDYADFQHVSAIIEQKQIDEDCNADGFNISPNALFTWLTRVQYNRRCEMDPFWCSWLIGGMQGDTPFLGFVDSLGAAFKDKVICTGFGAYLASPLLRVAHEANPNMSEEEAKAVIKEAMKVLYCRDGRSFPKYNLAVVTKEGSRIEGPIEVDAEWGIATFVKNR